jgi:UDP-N-acetylglucosamine--N-acetylmuramyl-(pentapeptide) pyrophosphoryl-undecaprenol N-acetylglucosamine transferase
MKRTLRILVTGGGTGGHVSPALATIGAISEMANEPDANWQPVFRYIGSNQGVEKKLALGAGLDFVGVQSGKLRRAERFIGLFSPKNILDAFKIPVGVVQSLWHVARFRPHVIFSTGGFVCVPPVVAGWALRVPIITHDQTVTVGLANKIAARFARRVALTFEGALEDLPPKIQERAFVTGNPVRPQIFEGDKTRGREFAGLDPADDHLPTLYVTGGAQGARIINRAVEDALGELLQICRIIHQCGQQPAGDEQDFDRLQAAAAKLPPELRRRYYLTRFVGVEIGDIFALTDLVVSRAGAGTITEVCALGKPALFVPLVPTGGDEQTRNARRSEEAGAAVTIKQGEMNGPRLLSEVRHLLSDPARLRQMGQNALLLARPNAARDLAQAVLKLGLGDRG